MIDQIDNYEVAEHQVFKVDGKYYLFLVKSSALFEMGGESHRLIDAIKKREASYLRSLKGKIKDDLIILKDIGAIQRINEPSHEGAKSREDLPGQSLVSLVCILSGDCNLRCAYCYADHVSYKGKRRGAKEEVIYRGVDFLLEEGGGNREVNLTFFGGEPLLNFPVLKSALKYARRKAREKQRNIGFSLTTNATLLTEDIISFLDDEGVSITVSIDGSGHIHDAVRKYPDGRGSYDVILNNLQRLFKRYRRKPVNARVTVVHGQVNIKDIFSHLSKIGFKDIGFSPVSTDNPLYSLTGNDLDIFTGYFGELSEDYLKRAINGEKFGFSNLSNLLKLIHEGTNKNYPCGGGLGLMGMGIDGELYVCHRFINNSRFYLGNIKEGIDRNIQRDFFNKMHLNKKILCQDCWARYLCGGGCYYEIELQSKGFEVPPTKYCKWLKEWFVRGVEVYIRIMQSNPDFIKRVIDSSIYC
ncbi:MAG: radical SAM protein [Nitrospinae bacterium]|nr:radical SAM protein [Nitrospinota bacterium]